MSNLADNLAKRIHKIKCKYEHDKKKYETCRQRLPVLRGILKR